MAGPDADSEIQYMIKKDTMKNTHLPSTEIDIVVPFHDLDPLQIVWHGNYLKYFDMARFALFEKLNIDLQDYYRKTNIIFPIIKTTTKHIIPLRHRDRVICKATLVQAYTKIVIDFQIRYSDRNEICCKGTGEQAAVALPGNALMLRIPDDIQKALGFSHHG
jgi:acyl-CoA thioester hydrolase